MKLNHLTDKTLLNDTKSLVKKEKEITTKVLHHLKEIERRRLFSDLGYSSLFAYTVKELGFCESSAFRRIQAARLLNDLPEIENKIETGELSLTNLGQASRFFKQNNVKAIHEKEKILKSIESQSKRECEKTLFKLGGKEQAPLIQKTRRNSASTQELKFTVKDQTMAKLEDLKNLLAHEGEKSMDELLDNMLDLAIEKANKKRFKLTSGSRKPRSPEKVECRFIANAVKRHVYNRDNGKCQKCGGNHKIQFDHQLPFALGGTTSVKNLRLLCFSCNQRQRIKAKL